MPKVEVPVIFSGTEGFPARRDARYIFYYLKPVCDLPIDIFLVTVPV